MSQSQDAPLNSCPSPFDTFVSTFEMSTFAMVPEPIEPLPVETTNLEAGKQSECKPADHSELPEIADPVIVVETPLEPIAEAVSEPAVEVVSEPVVETVCEPVVETVAEPIAETVSEAVVESVREPAVVTVPEPVAEAISESAMVTAAEPVAEAIAESAVVTVPEPIADAIPAPAVATVPEPVAEAISAPAVMTVPEPVVEAIAEPTDAAIREPAIKAKAEPVETAIAASDVEESKQKVTEDESKPEVIAAEVPSEFTFLDIPLREEVQQAVRVAGYKTPTKVQAEIIPHMLEGRDVLAQSQTGSGKTAAFALPILSRIEIGQRKPQVLVLAPTRELAIQVGRSFTTYAGGLPGFAVATIYGGQDYEVQFRQLRRGVEVVVGTPGRVIDHIKRGTLDLSGIKCLVLDEADEMLNMGFLEDVEFVLEQAPAERQIALFSATLPQPIRNIAQRYLKDPARITIQRKAMTAESIRQRALYIAPRDRIDVLTRILEVEETDGVIVFTKTKDATVTVAERLNREGLRAVALNGDMPQKTRERAIDQLKSGHLDILVATDVAARGLDVTRVSHVFNFDVPQDGESYIHRVGRTGRAGRKGEAIIFLAITQRSKLRLIEQAAKQTIEVVQPPTADDVNAMRIKRFKQRITEVTGTDDLTLFKKIIADYAEETGKPIEMIAAALAHIGQGGRPFFMKDRPVQKYAERQDRGNRQRHDRQGQGNFTQQRRGKSASDSRNGGPPEPGKSRYRIEVGWKDGVKVGNIVGAVANEGGIAGECIGPIKIHDSYSTLDLPEGMPEDVFQTLHRTRVAGKQLRLSLDNGSSGSRPRPRPAYRGGQTGSGGNGNGASGGKFVPAGKRKNRKFKSERRDQ